MKMVTKKTSKKTKWNRQFFLIKYPDGNFVALSSHQTFSIPKQVNKEDAYLFTPGKAKVYMDHYGKDYQLETVPVVIYLE